MGALEAKLLAKPMVNKSIILSFILQSWIFKDQQCLLYIVVHSI